MSADPDQFEMLLERIKTEENRPVDQWRNEELNAMRAKTGQLLLLLAKKDAQIVKLRKALEFVQNAPFDENVEATIRLALLETKPK